MAQRDELGLTKEENLQIEALKKGATPEEASLGGKLPRVEALSPVDPNTQQERTGRLVSSVSTSPVNQVVQEESSQMSISNVIDNTPDPADEKTLQEAATELSFLKTALDPLTSPQEAYRESLVQMRNASDRNALFQTYQDQWSRQQRQRVAEVAIATVNTGDTTPEEGAALIEASRTIEEEYQGLLGKERMFVDAYADVSFDQFQQDAAVARNYAWSKYKEFSDQQGLGRKIWNWTETLLLPDFIKDANDLTGNSLFSTKQDVLNIVAAYQNLPPNLKPEAFDDIFERATGAFEGNAVKLAGLVHMLHSPTAESDFNIAAFADIADIGLTAIGPLTFAARVASSGSKGTKLINKAAGVGAEREAATLNTLSEGRAVDNPASAVAGDRLDAAITKTPYRMEDYLMGIDSTDGLGYRIKTIKDETARQILKDVDEQVAQQFEGIRSEDFSVNLQALNNQEKEKAVGEFASKLAKRAEDEGLAYEEIGPVFQNDRGFTFEYKLAGETKRENIFWTRNDAGVFEGVNEGFKKRISNLPWFSKIFSPELKLNSVSDRIVSDVTFGGLQASRIKKSLINVAKQIDEGMSTKERQAVSELLIAGDEQGKVYSLSELKHQGVELVSGTRTYTDKEITNYYKKVAFNEELWSLRNHAVKRELEFMGAKSVSYKVPGTDANMKEFVGMPKESFQGITDELTENRPVLAPQLNDSGYINGANIDIAKMRDQGFKPVKLLEEYEVGNKKVKYALIRDDGPEGLANIKVLPDEVLNKQPGYVPRNYKPGYQFVKDVSSGKTIKAFENRANAEKFAREEMERIRNMSPEELEAAGLSKDVNYQVFRDRELNKMEALIEDANLYNGLYTGARKREPLLVGETGERLERMSWGESTQRYIDSLADTMPLNEYRIAMKERFVNSINKMYEMEGKPTTFGKLQNWAEEPIILNDSATANLMNETREYMKNQMSLWSNPEKKFNSFMMDIAEQMGGTAEKKIAVNIAHRDPMKSLHSAAFHAHLGWFNPRQLYVQAQNAALAISMHPVDGLQAANKAAAMQMFLRMPDDRMVAAINKLGNLPGINSERLIEDIRQFRRSGMEASIMRVADYDAAADGLTPGTLTKIREFSRKGLLFYENGELFSRLTAWNIAKRQWEKANPGKAIDDAAIRDITDDTFRYHMNLQRENAATWQQNILRLPTQFMQVQAKLLEKIVPAIIHGKVSKSGWSRSEAARVAAGQIVLYGTLGVPIAEQASNYLADKLGVTPGAFQEQHPLFAEAVQDGMNGVLMEMLGFQNQFGGDTASIFAGLDDNVVSGIIEIPGRLVANGHEGDSLEELFFGPSLNVVRRTGDAAIDTVNSLYAIWHEPSVENVAKSSLKTISDFAAITSTWSNARKLWHYHNSGAFYTNSGKVILDEEDLQGLNFRTLVAKGMGLPLDAEASYWALSKANRETAQWIGDAKSDYKSAIRQYMLDGNLDRLKGLQAHILAPFSQAEKKEILEGAVNDIVKQEGQSALDEELKKYFNYTVRNAGELPIRQDIGNIYQAREQKGEE